VSAQPITRQARVAMGTLALPVGELTFVRDGRREYSGFSYAAGWLHSRERFEISPDLPLRAGFMTRYQPNARGVDRIRLSRCSR
jgi:hypothetical protein